MAANMIGVKKNIIIVAIGPMDLVLNPRITKQSHRNSETKKDVLSHTGTKNDAYQTIEVAYTRPGWDSHHSHGSKSSNMRSTI